MLTKKTSSKSIFLPQKLSNTSKIDLPTTDNLNQKPNSFGKKKKTLEQNASCFSISAHAFLLQDPSKGRKFLKYFARIREILAGNHPNKEFVYFQKKFSS